jgi:hypothetical protein
MKFWKTRKVQRNRKRGRDRTPTPAMTKIKRKEFTQSMLLMETSPTSMLVKHTKNQQEEESSNRTIKGMLTLVPADLFSGVSPCSF